MNDDINLNFYLKNYSFSRRDALNRHARGEIVSIYF